MYIHIELGTCNLLLNIRQMGHFLKKYIITKLQYLHMYEVYYLFKAKYQIVTEGGLIMHNFDLK